MVKVFRNDLNSGERIKILDYELLIMNCHTVNYSNCWFLFR